MIYQGYAAIYQYTRSAIYVYYHILSHRDAALREVVQPSLCSEQQDDDRDPDPCPSEAEELFDAPGAESMEEAINKFVDGFPEEQC
jgi:hypothetical protein